VKSLHQVGKSQRNISKLLGIARNSVRDVLHKTETDRALIKNRDQELVTKITPLIAECRDNLVRVHEKLTSEYQVNLAYSSLTY
jgi:predicted transcriptional regulator